MINWEYVPETFKPSHIIKKGEKMNIKQAIEELLPKWNHEIGRTDRYSDVEREAYKLIVRACNSHEELLEGAKTAVICFKALVRNDIVKNLPGWILELQTAISNAEGNTK